MGGACRLGGSGKSTMMLENLLGCLNKNSEERHILNIDVKMQKKKMKINK